MNTKLFYTALVSLMCSVFCLEAKAQPGGGSITVQNVNIPDATLKRSLVSLADTDSDGEITITEAQAFSGAVNINGFFSTIKITDLTGIEAFTGITSIDARNQEIAKADFSKNTLLETIRISDNLLTSLDVNGTVALADLYCNGNNLTSLDVTSNVNLRVLSTSGNAITSLDLTQNIALESLQFQGNSNGQLTALDITNNTALEYLECSYHELTTLDVTQNTALVDLSVGNNLLTALDVTQNTALVDLSVGNNLLTALDVTENTALTDLSFNNNNISSIDISMNTVLEYLNCNNNGITILDVSDNTNLISLDVSDNSLTTFDISNLTVLSNLFVDNNNLTSLNIANGNNANFLNGHLQDNINLTCIQVDDIAVANTKFFKDATASYSTTSCTSTANTVDNVFNNQIKVYPNPVINALKIEVATGETLKSVQVFTLLGKKVLEGNNTTINFNTISKGIYLLKIENENGKIAVRKIIKE